MPEHPSFKLAIIGNGTSAVNHLRALAAEYQKSGLVLPPIEVTIFGDGPESECGQGFAFGQIGGIAGNLTEPVQHADYGPDKGEFAAFAAAATGTPPDEITSASRELAGKFHTDEYSRLKKGPSPFGKGISYFWAKATHIGRDGDQYCVTCNTAGHFTGFDHVLLAVGDVLSPAFDGAATEYPAQVFGTPYHALPALLEDRRENLVTVARGTRSSFVDLVNASFENGYRGKIIGISPSGLVPWQARDDAQAFYKPQFLIPGRGDLRTTAHVLAALRDELHLARKEGAYVPQDLMTKIVAAAATQRNAAPRWNEAAAYATERRLAWWSDIKEEAAHADKRTYHEVVQAVDWDSIYRSLSNDGERRTFNLILGDFILYNRVNKIVPSDYRAFIDHIEAGRAEIRQGCFEQDSLCLSIRKQIAVQVTNLRSDVIQADYVVNCAIGPSPSSVQAEENRLLKNLVHQGWLTPQEGTGFTVADGLAISLAGSQGREFPFSSIGLESYGRQAVAFAEKIVAQHAIEAIPPDVVRRASNSSNLNL